MVDRQDDSQPFDIIEKAPPPVYYPKADITSIISPPAAEVGQPFTVYVDVSNVGDAAGTIWCKIVDEYGVEVGKRQEMVMDVAFGDRFAFPNIIMPDEPDDIYSLTAVAGHVE